MPKKTDKDKPTAFKHWIDTKLLDRMSRALVAVDPSFDARSLRAVAPRLAPLELKPRVRLVRDALHELLPKDFEKAARLLVRSTESDALDGFDLWPYTEWVQAHGLDHFDASMRALNAFTRKFTAEFAVRPFLAKHPARTLKLFATWALDPDEHVRRLVSEGSRPRLPWGERLSAFIADPSPTLPLLESLKHDEALYVRKSVANHLNDIAKDHPEVVEQLLKRWQAEAPPAHAEKIDWIVRRSLRTLIKQGRPASLALVGVDSAAKVKVEKLAIGKSRLRFGETLEFDFDLVSSAHQAQKLVVDYVIHHAKARGHTTPKVFKLRVLTLGARERIALSKRHALRLITTRRYHPGAHALEIQVNGRIAARVDWELKA